MNPALEEIFAKIENRLASIDPNNPDRKVVHVFKIRIKSGDEVFRTMMLDLVAVRFYEGDDDAECTIELDRDLLVDVVTKVKDVGEALQEGLIQAEGNLDLLGKLRDKLSSIE